MHPVRWIVALAACMFMQPVFGQRKAPLLEREVSITASNESAASVLAQLASQTGIKFSYSPSLIPADKKVSFRVTKKPLRTVLQLMFADAVQVKEKGSFIILTAKPQAPPQTVVKEIVIQGYVYDDKGEKLAYASIFNQKEQTAAVTNRYGYYSLKVAADKLPIDLRVVKENYNDTAVKISAKQTQVDVVLKEEEKPQSVEEIKTFEVRDTLAVFFKDTIIPAQPVAATPDSSVADKLSGFKNILNQLALSEEDKANIRNLKDTLFSVLQLSVIPQLSTNKLLVGNTVNDFSLSLLLGYSKGINIASVSGLMNYATGPVKYAQAAGMVNVVEGDVTGGQASGLVNLVEGNVLGGQAAGILNVVEGGVTGGQAAGILNVADSNVVGAQAAGIMNIVSGNMLGAQAAGIGNIVEGDFTGAQVAGIFNVTDGNTYGAQVAGISNLITGGKVNIQIAGICNISDGEVEGVQVAGIGNVAGKPVKGVQVAGLFNVSDSVINGVQVSGFLNDAKEVNGFQLGLINYAEVNNGISFGLFSFTQRGYHKLEVFGDDVMSTNLAFRTGVQKFHNIFIGGVDLSSRTSGLWNFGYGLGSFFNMGSKWKIGGDVTAQVYLKGGNISKAPQVNHFFIGVERAFGKKFSVAIGPTYHVMVNYSGDNEIADLITPYSFYNKTYVDGTNLRMWVGGKLSLKFF